MISKILLSLSKGEALKVDFLRKGENKKNSIKTINS